MKARTARRKKINTYLEWMGRNRPADPVPRCVEREYNRWAHRQNAAQGKGDDIRMGIYEKALPLQGTPYAFLYSSHPTPKQNRFVFQHTVAVSVAEAEAVIAGGLAKIEAETSEWLNGRMVEWSNGRTERLTSRRGDGLTRHFSSGELELIDVLWEPTTPNGETK